MYRTIFKRLVTVAVVATAMLALGVSRADAGWRHYYYGLYSGPYVVADCGWGGYVAYRPYVRHVYRGWAHAGCCAPVVPRGCCAPVVSYGCCAPVVPRGCCAPVVSYGCCAPVAVPGCCGSAQPAPAGKPGPAPTQAPSPPADLKAPAPIEAPSLPGKLEPSPPTDLKAPAVPAPDGQGSQALSRTRSAVLAVTVPEGAKIFVNGRKTVSTGSQRRYVSHNLIPGYRYTYQLRAELTQDGRTVEQVRVVSVRAGDVARVAFDFGETESGNTLASAESAR